MQNTAQHRIITKRILLIVAGLLIVVALSIVALYILFPRHKPVATQAQTKSSPSAAAIVSSYLADTTDGNRDKDYIQQQTVIKNPTILYKLDPAPYQVAFTPTSSLIFSRKDGAAKTNTTTITSATDAFFTKNGLTKVTSATFTGYTATTYASPEAVCQFSDYPGLTAESASFVVSCTGQEALKQASSDIDILLTIYKKSHTLTDPKTITATTITADNKQLTTLAITDDTHAQAYKLLFAAVNKSWSYIGARQAPSIDDAASFALSAELKQAIADAKYGDFLAKNIQ